MAIAYLCLGGNLGQREVLLAEACRMLETESGRIIRSSSVYETEAWGFSSENTFYNQVVVLETPLVARELLDRLHRIESSLGRDRKNESGFASRTMDIDILFFDQEMIVDNDLEIPHPRMAMRKFVLIPLLEINPALMNPRTGKTVWQLFRECKDQGKIRKMNTDYWL